MTDKQSNISSVECDLRFNLCRDKVTIFTCKVHRSTTQSQLKPVIRIPFQLTKNLFANLIVICQLKCYVTPIGVEVIDRIVLHIPSKASLYSNGGNFLPRRYIRFHRPVGAMLKLQGWQRRVVDHT